MGDAAGPSHDDRRPHAGHRWACAAAQRRGLPLSDLSAALAEFAADGELLGLLLLWSGRHGLKADVPQAEGIATDPDGTIYVVSEPNLFYRFAPSGQGSGRVPRRAGEGQGTPAPLTATRAAAPAGMS